LLDQLVNAFQCEDDNIAPRKGLDEGSNQAYHHDRESSDNKYVEAQWAFTRGRILVSKLINYRYVIVGPIAASRCVDYSTIGPAELSEDIDARDGFDTGTDD
jgi:hypothetical protein